MADHHTLGRNEQGVAQLDGLGKRGGIIAVVAPAPSLFLRWN